MRVERALDARIADATDMFRVGQVSSVVGNKVSLSISGTTKTVPRLATWTPVVGDMVLVAVTQYGWVAVGKIA